MNPTNENKVREGFNKMRRKYEAPPEYRNPNEFLDKPLPSNIDAENTSIGCVLLDNRLAPQLFAHGGKPADFYSPINQKIVEAIEILFRKGKKIDPILIGEEMVRAGHSLDAIGGTPTIMQKTYGLPHFDDISEYMRIVRTHSLARHLLIRAQRMQTDILDGEMPIDVIMSDFLTELIALQERNGELRTESLGEVVTDVVSTLREWQTGNLQQSSLKTGIPELDRKLKLRGIAKGEMTLFAARPSTGKTALLLQIATHVIRSLIPVLFISLEMLKGKLVMRMLPPITGVDNKAINPTTMQNSPEDAKALFKALETLKDFPMYFDREKEIKKMIATAEFFCQTKGVEMIVFDYLTLFKNGLIGQGATRDKEVGDITNELKDLGVRRNVAMLGAAQMNRESERDFRRPQMSDLRESGQIEQAADVIAFLWDEKADVHAKNPDLIKDDMEVAFYCAKQRDGERGWTIKMQFDKNHQTFETEQIRKDRLTLPTAEFNALPQYIKDGMKRQQDEDDDDLRFKI
jgi:replicative DNA helicase